MVSIGQRCLWHHCLRWKPAPCEKHCNHWRQKMRFAGRPLGLPLPKRSFWLFLLGVLALNRLAKNKAQQFRRHQHLNIIRWTCSVNFCDVSDLPNSTINWSADKLIFWDHSLNCAQGDRYRVIRHGSDLGFVALEDGRPMPRDQRDESPRSEGSEGLELPLKHAQEVNTGPSGLFENRLALSHPKSIG